MLGASAAAVVRLQQTQSESRFGSEVIPFAYAIARQEGQYHDTSSPAIPSKTATTSSSLLSCFYTKSKRAGAPPQKAAPAKPFAAWQAIHPTLTPGLLISLVNTGKESLESLRGRHFRRAGPPGLKCTSTSIYIIHLVAVYSRVSIIVSYSTPYASMESSSWTCPFAGLLTEVENNPSVPSQATPDIPKSGGDEGLMRPTIAVSSLHPFAVFSPPLLTPTGPFNI